MRLAVLGIVLASLALSGIESLINFDLFHWGLVFSSAADLLAGRVPYRETYEYYGLLTPLLQLAWMKVFGVTVVQTGLVTGVCYGAYLVLHYTIALRFLAAPWALLSTLLLFLAHPYIVYPWSNYFSGLFGAIAVWAALGVSQRRFALAGGSLAAAYLCRHSVVLSLLPPFFLLVLSHWRRERFGTRVLLPFVLALGLPVLIYFLWLVSAGLFSEWWVASVDVNQALYQTVAQWKSVSTPTQFILLLWKKMFFSVQPQLLVFTLLSWTCLFTEVEYFYRLFKKQTSWQDFNGMPFLAAMALCGFLQAGHSYELFRIATASGLGTVVAVWRLQRWADCGVRRHIFLLAGLSVWCGILFFTLLSNNQILRPWPSDTMARLLQKPPAVAEHLPVFAGKAWPASTFEYYEGVRGALAVGRACGISSVVNLTTCDAFSYYLLEGTEKPQREPCRIPWHRSDELYPDEPKRRELLRQSGRAVFVIPNGVPGPEGYALAFSQGPAVVWLPERCIRP